MTFGQAPSFVNPANYVGDTLYTIAAVNQPRAPTISDRNYPLATLWRNNNNNAVSPDALGDIWALLRFRAPSIVPGNTQPDAIWAKLVTGSVPGGTVLSLSDTTATKTFPDATGNIQLVGGTGIDVVSTPSSNLLTISSVGGDAITKLGVQGFSPPGTNPVLPDGTGTIDIVTRIIAASSTPIIIGSSVANQAEISVQASSISAASNATQNGVSHFDSHAFAVDANGFVQLLGGGTATEQFTVDASTAPGTNPVVPTAAGTIIVTGGQVAAGTTANVIQTNSLAANTYAVQIQRSKAVSTSTVADNGVCHFNSNQFSVDGNGFTSLSAVTFNAYLSSTQDNVTGDGTVYSIIFDTIVNQTGSAYNTGTGVFTAPVAGWYFFNARVLFGNFGGGATYTSMDLITTALTYSGPSLNVNTVGANAWTSPGSTWIVYMNASDTAYIIGSAVNGTKSVNIVSSTNPVGTYFQGGLLR